MQLQAAFPPNGETRELVEWSEGLVHDVAELVHALDVGLALAGYDRQDAAATQLMAVGIAVVPLVTE
jgi:hypothetical protein